MSVIPVSSMEVNYVRDQYGCDLHTAKRVVQKRKVVELICKAQTVRELVPVLIFLLEDFETGLPEHIKLGEYKDD
jgi:hypothetical protein